MVYDSIDPSPYYDAMSEQPYIDESDAVEIPGENDFKKQMGFGPMNSNSYLANINSKGLKVNRYYSKLNPYYVK